MLLLIRMCFHFDKHHFALGWAIVNPPKKQRGQMTMCPSTKLNHPLQVIVKKGANPPNYYFESRAKTTERLRVLVMLRKEKEKKTNTESVCKFSMKYRAIMTKVVLSVFGIRLASCACLPPSCSRFPCPDQPSVFSTEETFPFRKRK